MAQSGTPLEKQLIPYQIVRFPMKISSTIQQFDKKELDFGTDMDRDGINEKVDAQGTSTVTGIEFGHCAGWHVQGCGQSRSVYADEDSSLRRHENCHGYGCDDGLVCERSGIGEICRTAGISPLEDRGVITEISEELESYEIKPPKASLGRSEPSTEGLFADNSRDDKLHQVVLAPGLRPDS